MKTIHHVKKVKIIPVFLWSPITLCLFVLSSISIKKQCDNYPSSLRKSTYLYTRFSNSINEVRSEARTLWTAHLRPCRTLGLIVYGTGTNKVTGNPFDLLQWFGLLHYGIQTDKLLVFLCSPLLKSLICLQCDSILCLKFKLVWKWNTTIVEKETIWSWEQS